MKRAIKEKLLNLVTFNPIDYCIKSSITQKHIDISKYVDESAFINFMTGENPLLEISAASGISIFEKELKNTTNPEQLVSLITNNGFSVSQNRQSELQSNFEVNKKKTIAYYIDQMKAFKRQFISLNQTANNYYNDSTIWPLYIAYRFLKGKIGNNIIIKAPLTIFKVAVIEEGSKLYLKKLEDQVIVNEKIQIVMNKEFPSITKTEDLLKSVEFNEYIERFEKMVGYKIKIDEVEILKPFVNETTKQIEETYSNLVIENSALLGIFEPGGGALKEDLKEIIARDEDPFESQIEGDVKSNAFYEDKIIKDPTYIYEIGKPLNIFQKYAVASSLNQSTLIYGPPGTGKSEVIANIICNALINGKSTLMVSEKKAALEVLTSRISSLSQFALYLYESTSKEHFYKKIDSLNSLLGTQWYRDSARVTKINAKIEPLKFNKDELMFVKNYEDWYVELVRLLKKHWTIEDYEDGIFKLDYIDVQNIKDELGEELCIEWLQNVNIEGYGSTTLLEAFKKVYSTMGIIFPSIDIFFKEYLKFKKFVKKFNLLEKFNSEEINKFLRNVLNKISLNTRIVEKFLLGGSKLSSIFQEYFDFLENYKGRDTTAFIEKTYKEKKQFISLIESYLDFRNRVITKDLILSQMTGVELSSKVKIIEDFFTKYKKQISNQNWFNFMTDQSRQLDRFIQLYDTASSEEAAEVIFAEFIINKTLIPKIEESTLNMKQIKTVAKDISALVPMFRDFINNREHLDNNYAEEIVIYKDLLKYEVNYLEALAKVSIIFDPIYQEILKEWDWISEPYIKYLYQNPIIPFDIEKIQNVINLITTPINDDQFTKLKIVAMWSNIIRDNPMFLELKGIHIQDVIHQMRKESIRSAAIIEELIFKKYINNLRTYLTRLPKEDKDEVANVLRIASSSVRPSIGQFIKHYYRALKILFPIWVARPDNVADMIPLNAKEFDYGIFDEASQISIERAYPIVYRTDIKIVSGDDKQLRPSSFFMTKLNQQDYDIDDFDAVESLLERAKVSWWNEYHLRNHYRSDSKELIEFSNKFIYGNSLEVATKANVRDGGIEVYNVNGLWEQINKAEADKVIDILIDKYQHYGTILIITFNSKQSLLIENLLLEKRSKLPTDLVEKIDKNEVIVTNLENVQGNEGDLVILSVSYGKNIDGIVKSNFGPLILSGGSNRLNVAITRAKQKMVVVKSINGDQIRVNPQNKNAVIFKKFIEYIDGIVKNIPIEYISPEIIEIDENLEVQPVDVVPTVESSRFSSQIVKDIYGDLIKSFSNKYDIVNDYKAGSKNIDLLIINKQTKLPIKAILIEKWKANRTIMDMLEDIDRQNFLEDRGYSTFRINQYSWCIDRNKIITKIKDSIANMSAQQIDYVLWQTDK